MTTKLISFFATRDANASLENHRRYCASRAYTHEFVDASSIGWAHLRVLLKYQTLLRAMRAMPDGDLILLLTQDCLIVRDIACEALMEAARDHITVSMGDAGHDTVIAAFQLWRNTAASREMVERLCARARFGSTAVSESELLRSTSPFAYITRFDDVHPAVPAAWHIDPIWTQWRAFTIALADIPDAPPNQPVHADLRDLFAEHINACQANGQPYLTLPPQPEPQAVDTAYEALNPDAPIALVMLYTPNIRAYGEIAERNLRRYCTRHGYALHVYRDLPQEAGQSASGNWLKPWVLRRHLPSHEWVMWIDADVLVIDQSTPLDALFTNRDRLIAMDMSWQFNSGIMGFRRTPQNLDVLAEVEETIGGVADKSSTYASGGDQDAFIKVLMRHGMASDAELVDCITLNTPYQLQKPDSFMVHYMHMWLSLRALAMHRGDLASRHMTDGATT
ncbi:MULTISPECIES: hypothetical protein [unclassified Caballeronia]|uniref:hypothetical protein n=1 Tax=unclassified Caballeronia TaxID=2646786 RepID=UPI00285B8C88|nr:MULTISPECIES: hypothetical protein [unclassified Caballeronia]MDR5740831.1 hypothetical protein [Caballeronia sp. LZ016]MDR5808648.1 hypothetical protein [Caballeronia sp. LZ019]